MDPSTYSSLAFTLLGLVIAIFALVVGMFGYIVKIASHLARHDQQFDNMEKSIDLRFAAMDAKFDQRLTALDDKFDQRLTAIEKAIDRLPCEHHRDMIEEARISIISAGASPDNPGPVLGAHSPLSPTEEGWKAIRELHLDEMLERNWGPIAADLAKASPQLPYMIHIRAVGTAAAFPKTYLQQPDIDAIGSYAYQKGADMRIYLQLFGVLARDRYIKETGMPPE